MPSIERENTHYVLIFQIQNVALFVFGHQHLFQLLWRITRYFFEEFGMPDHFKESKFVDNKRETIDKVMLVFSPADIHGIMTPIFRDDTASSSSLHIVVGNIHLGEGAVPHQLMRQLKRLVHRLSAFEVTSSSSFVAVQ